MKKCEACSQEFPACIFDGHLELCEKVLEQACQDDVMEYQQQRSQARHVEEHKEPEGRARPFPLAGPGANREVPRRQAHQDRPSDANQNPQPNQQHNQEELIQNFYQQRNQAMRGDVIRAR